MDHVYGNEPRGRTALGREIDRRLLGRRTCQAFREIRVLAREALADAAAASSAPEPLIADLAAGPAPYVFEVLAAHPGARALLADIDPAALAQARAHAERLGLADRVAFTQASAFDRDALERIDPRPGRRRRARAVRHLPRRRADRAPLRRPGRDDRPRADRVQRADPEPRDRAHREGVARPPRRAVRVAAAAGRVDPARGPRPPATSRRRFAPTATGSTGSGAWCAA